MLNANFWQDKANSNKVIKEKKFYEELTNSFENSIKGLDDLDDLYKLAKRKITKISKTKFLKILKDWETLLKKMR